MWHGRTFCRSFVTALQKNGKNLQVRPCHSVKNAVPSIFTPYLLVRPCHMKNAKRTALGTALLVRRTFFTPFFLERQKDTVTCKKCRSFVTAYLFAVLFGQNAVPFSHENISCEKCRTFWYGVPFSSSGSFLLRFMAVVIVFDRLFVFSIRRQGCRIYFLHESCFFAKKITLFCAKREKLSQIWTNSMFWSQFWTKLVEFDEF